VDTAQLFNVPINLSGGVINEQSDLPAFHAINGACSRRGSFSEFGFKEYMDGIKFKLITIMGRLVFSYGANPSNVNILCIGGVIWGGDNHVG